MKLVEQGGGGGGLYTFVYFLHDQKCYFTGLIVYALSLLLMINETPMQLKQQQLDISWLITIKPVTNLVYKIRGMDTGKLSRQIVFCLSVGRIINCTIFFFPSSFFCVLKIKAYEQCTIAQNPNYFYLTKDYGRHKQSFTESNAMGEDQC